MSIAGTCAGCGLPGHRYGTTDPHHDYNATACVNSLRGVLDEIDVTALAKERDALCAEIDALTDQRDALRFVVATLWRESGKTEDDASHPSWSNRATSVILNALRVEAP